MRTLEGNGYTATELVHYDTGEGDWMIGRRQGTGSRNYGRLVKCRSDVVIDVFAMLAHTHREGYGASQADMRRNLGIE